MAESIDVLERILVLVGRTGNGKSSTGNAILGRNAFFANVSPSSVTQQHQVERAHREGKTLIIVDTPGMFDTQKGNMDRLHEINDSLQAVGPRGVHGLLLVLRVHRFTPEENQTVALLAGLFGLGSLKHTIVVFTNTAELKDKSLRDFISENTNLQAIVENCNNQFVGIENEEHNAEDLETSVKDILDKIEEVSNNGRKTFIPSQNDRMKKLFEQYKEKETADETTAGAMFVDIVAEIRNQMKYTVQAMAVEAENLSGKEEKQAARKALEKKVNESNKELANWKLLGQAVLLTGGVVLTGFGVVKCARAISQTPTVEAIQKLGSATAPVLVETGKQALETVLKALIAEKLGTLI